MSNYDIIIVGSGIVGAAAALSLAKNTSLQIAILDSQSPSLVWQQEKIDHRVSAISLASKNIFKNLRVWEKMTEKRISPYVHMQVWDENSNGKIEFDCADVQERALGYIIEDSVMRTSLHALFSEYKNIHFLHPLQLISLHEKADCVELITSDKQIISAKLLIAADGANSWVREQANLELKTWDYEQVAIVATVKTQMPHHATARQRFLATGPLAFLPLTDSHSSSIVWSTTPAHAAELKQLDNAAFQDALAKAFDFELGLVEEVSPRYQFPLRMRHVKNYVKSRIALIGDAAHTIHPLAGQGVNLGLLDAMSLTEVVMEALNKKRDFASFATLRKYERWRKGDNLTMLAMVEALKFIFTSEKRSLQTLRSTGMNATNYMNSIKSFLVNYALGKHGDLPKMAIS